jgi:hypothetical protein
MRGLIDVAPWLVPAALLLAAIAVGVVGSFIPLRLWIEPWFSGVRIGLGTLVGMRLRTVNPPTVIRPLIGATKAGVRLDVSALEAHALAGGNVGRVVYAPAPRHRQQAPTDQPRTRRQRPKAVGPQALGCTPHSTLVEQPYSAAWRPAHLGRLRPVPALRERQHVFSLFTLLHAPWSEEGGFTIRCCVTLR